MWSAQRSSILQAVVSVQGLVLVKEPYVNNQGLILEQRTNWFLAGFASRLMKSFEEHPMVL